MRYFLLAVLATFFIQSTVAQKMGVIGGVVGSRYFFLESPQSNLVTKFNLGWDLAASEDNQLLYFDKPKLDTANKPIIEYKLDKEMKWDQMATGWVFGVRFTKDKIDNSFYFQGATNKATGSRTNMSTGGNEKFTLLSKFGGIRYSVCYHLLERLGLFYSVGVNRYRIKYEWNSLDRPIDKTTIGYNLKLGGALKPGSKKWNFVQSVGVELDLLRSERFALTLRPEFTFAFNAMSEVYRGPMEERYLFNLNQFNLGLIIQMLGK